MYVYMDVYHVYMDVYHLWIIYCGILHCVLHIRVIYHELA